MHYEEIAAVVLRDMGLLGAEPPKALNTALHDDPGGRFARVGKGTWALHGWHHTPV